MKLLHLLAVLCLASLAANAAAEGPSLEIGGSLRTGYFGASRKLDGERGVGTAALWLNASTKAAPGVTLFADGWLRNDRSPRGDDWRSRLREAYLDTGAGNLDLRVGRQIIAWGKADELNPTDNLTPRDYTLLVPETAGQRLGTLAARAAWHAGDNTVSAIWMPEFRPHVVPIAPAPGIVFNERVPSARQRGFKFEHTGNVDWSVSWFSGLDLNPDFSIVPGPGAGATVTLEHEPVRVLGFDAATVAGPYGLRMEAAYTWADAARTDNPLVKKPFLYIVAGGDRSFGEDFNVNLQLYLRRVAGYRDPRQIADPLIGPLAVQAAVISNQLDRIDHGISFRFASRWLNQTLEAELAGVVSLTHGDYALRPKLVYAVNDQLKATLGAVWFRGGDATYFGRLRNMSAVFAELKYSF